MDQGFDSYYGVLHNLDRFETVFFEQQGGMPVLRGNEVDRRPAVPAEMTSLYTQEAVKFIEENATHQFFLYLAHAMPHIPFDASDAYKGKSSRGLYGDCVEELDASTGTILDRLRSLGLAEKTLVIFTSDNGPERNTPGTAAPLTGTKHTVYEGGLRVPYIVWWPGKVPAGQVNDEFISALDMLPSLAKVAGSELPADFELDGFDISDVMLGVDGAKSGRQTLYSLYGLNNKRQESMRVGSWKLHLTSPPLLFDLSSDPAEQQNMADKNPEVVQRLQSQLLNLRRRTQVSE